MSESDQTNAQIPIQRHPSIRYRCSYARSSKNNRSKMREKPATYSAIFQSHRPSYPSPLHKAKQGSNFRGSSRGHRRIFHLRRGERRRVTGTAHALATGHDRSPPSDRSAGITPIGVLYTRRRKVHPSTDRLAGWLPPLTLIRSPEAASNTKKPRPLFGRTI